MQQWSVPAWAALAVLVVALCVIGALALALLRTRARLAETAALRERIVDVERRLADAERSRVDEAPARPDPEEYVITHAGDPEPEGAREPAPTVPAPLFADLVLRETVVQAASLAAGLRRALAPEARNRIRFEMKREVRRARKQRKADLRQARREWEARQRANLEPESAA